MPTTEEISDALKVEVAALGLPDTLVDSFMTATASAGFDFSEIETGTPTAAVIEAESAKLRAPGLPGAYLSAINLGTRGWVAWLEWNEGGSVVRSQPVVLTGEGPLIGE